MYFTSALLVEDEPSLTMALKIALKKIGISTMSATTLAQARGILANEPADLILLDRNLPDGDGLELCTELRIKNYSGSILVLTAVGQTQDRVQGLNQGADDYLPKPFSWEELEARIKALGRRKVAQASVSSHSENWERDSSRLRIHGPQGWVELTPLEFKLAERLIDAGGSIVTRDGLLKDVWGFTLLPKTRTVDHFLGRLRKHFESNAEEPRHFLTVRGAGYRFER